MIEQHSLSDDIEMMPLYREVGTKLQAQLDGGEDDAQEKEREAAEAAAKLEAVKKEQQEMIR